MPHKEETIKRSISAYISKRGGFSSRWYVGITSDPEVRLFTEHKVNRSQGSWAYAEAYTHLVARRIEEYYISKGLSGGTGGGDESSRWVYVYKRTSNTDP